MFNFSSFKINNNLFVIIFIYNIFIFIIQFSLDNSKLKKPEKISKYPKILITYIFLKEKRYINCIRIVLPFFH